MAQKLLLLYGLMVAGTVIVQLAFGDRLLDLWQVDGAWTGGGLAMDIGLGLGVGLGTVLLNRWLSRSFKWARRIDAEFREMLAPVEAGHVFGLAVMSALAEELLFRGFVQPLLGLHLTALGFGLAHLPHRREQVPWTIAAAIMGYVFGGLMLLRGCVAAPVVAHFLINFFNLHHLIRPITPEEA